LLKQSGLSEVEIAAFNGNKQPVAEQNT
jgi:hypothetical protein